MIVILNNRCFDNNLKREVPEEMVFDTKDWALMKFRNRKVLKSLHNTGEYCLTETGYNLVKSAMVGWNQNER